MKVQITKTNSYHQDAHFYIKKSGYDVIGKEKAENTTNHKRRK